MPAPPTASPAAQPPSQYPGFGPAQPFGTPGYDPYQQQARGTSRGPLIAAVVGGLVLVAAFVAGGVLLFGGDSDDGDDTHRATTEPSASQDDEPDSRQKPESERPAPDTSDVMVDASTGLSLPLLQGWKELGSGPGGSAAGIGRYPCPTDASLPCLHGGVVIQTANDHRATDAEGVAKEDIAENAKDNYNRKAYGGITSHRKVLSEKVTVAGQQGYRVRWKIVNRNKPDAYVESVAFPSPAGSGDTVLLRFGFDIHDDAPPLRDIDTIIRGIKVATGDASRAPNEV